MSPCRRSKFARNTLNDQRPPGIVSAVGTNQKPVSPLIVGSAGRGVRVTLEHDFVLGDRGLTGGGRRALRGRCLARGRGRERSNQQRAGKCTH